MLIEILLNKVMLDVLANKDGSSFNPFKQPHYMLLNLAMAGKMAATLAVQIFPVCLK
jgi:hypothetical protein